MNFACKLTKKSTLFLCSTVYDIVMLWLCKWQLTHWVGVNAAVHSVAIGERRKQVINNINNLMYWKWSIACKNLQDVLIVYFFCHTSITPCDLHVLIKCIAKRDIRLSFLINQTDRLENKTNYTLTVLSCSVYHSSINVGNSA